MSSKKYIIHTRNFIAQNNLPIFLAKQKALLSQLKFKCLHGTLHVLIILLIQTETVEH